MIQLPGLLSLQSDSLQVSDYISKPVRKVIEKEKGKGGGEQSKKKEGDANAHGRAAFLTVLTQQSLTQNFTAAPSQASVPRKSVLFLCPWKQTRPQATSPAPCRAAFKTKQNKSAATKHALSVLKFWSWRASMGFSRLLGGDLLKFLRVNFHRSQGVSIMMHWAW